MLSNETLEIGEKMELLKLEKELLKLETKTTETDILKTFKIPIKQRFYTT
jgi:hypothetical protein